jgi:hypothetical protein
MQQNPENDNKDVPKFLSNYNDQPRPTALKVAGLWVVNILFYALALAAVYLVIVIFSWPTWYAEVVFPAMGRISFVVLSVLILPTIALSIIKQTRPLGGAGFVLISYILGFNLWIWCLYISLVLAGIIGIIIGLLFFGFGVVFIATAFAAWWGEWLVVLQIIVLVFLTFGSRALGNFLAGALSE